MGLEKPLTIDPIAQSVLDGLAKYPAAREIVLGGYFALSNWVPYRTTHDIDAWWRGQVDPETQAAITSVMTEVAGKNGLRFSERRSRETISYELSDDRGKKTFSFQIAIRSVELSAPSVSRWAPVMIESLEDNLGSKMNALVNRGAPRDFTDIKAAVDAGLVSVTDCFDLWQRKNPALHVEQAKLNIQHFLASLEQRRPLESIKDPADKAKASEVRTWFKETFLAK